MAFISAMHKINLGFTYLIGLLALILSFFLPAEIPVIILILAYPYAFYSIGQFVGMGNEWYSNAIGVLWKILAITIIVFAIIYWRYGLIHEGQHVEISIFQSFYFSVTTWTTLGYGDFSPIPRIRHITSVQAILGYIGLGMWVALINGLVQAIAGAKREIQENNGGK